MKRPTFWHGVAVAAILGLFASIVIAGLTPFVGTGAVLRLVIPALALFYLLYLLGRSEERTGRVTIMAAWSAVTVLTWWFAPPLPFYAAIHIGAIWLVRSLYFYVGVMPAILDLALTGLSVSASIWAMTRSSSIFLATWCFFLVQALFVTIPPAINRKSRQNTTGHIGNEAFELARQRADAAIRQLVS
jgi:hypothetical protein